MQRKTLKGNFIRTIDWNGDNIIDWASGGELYLTDGGRQQSGSYMAFSFDGSITSADGQYAFIYKRLGTKGLLLKNGDILREINRSYYFAEAYEYPAAFVTTGGKTFLVHCPISYCQLDLEDVETGEIITNIEGRKPSDIFHSRLTVSPDNKYLMVCGWAWHPVDTVELFNISDCLEHPLLLDKSNISPDFGTQINSASFIDTDSLLIAASDEHPFDDEIPPALPRKHIAIWNFLTNEISKPVKPNTEFGNLFAIDDEFAWDMYKYPKIINIRTGEVKSKMEEIHSGTQISSIMDSDIKNCPQICFNRENKMIAVYDGKQEIEVLIPG